MMRRLLASLLAIMMLASTFAAAEGSLEADAEAVRTAATLNGQLELLYELSVEHASELESGGWGADLKIIPSEDIPEAYIPNMLDAEASNDGMPEALMNAKFFPVYDRFETDGSLNERLLPGDLYVRLPEANRARTINEADAALYLTEVYEARNDYIGEAYDRAYILYAAALDGSCVYRIGRTSTRPPVSGMGVLTGKWLSMEELWQVFRKCFYTEYLSLERPEGILTFRVTGSSCCLTGAEGDFKRLEIPSEVEGIPVTGVEKIENSCVEALVIPEGITYISGYRAISCPNLTAIQFPSTLRRISGDDVFEDTKLTELSFNEGLEEIGENAVQGGDRWTAVYLPPTLKSIENGYLSNGLAGTWAVLPEGVTRVPSSFLTTPRRVECVFLPASIEEFGINVLNSTNSTRVYAPEGSAAEAWAREKGKPYYPCANADDMPKPEIVTEGPYTYTVVEDEAVLIRYTGSDSDVVVPDTLGGYPVTVLKMFAFTGLNDVKTLRFPESVRMLERWCVSGCEALEAIYVPGFPSEAYYFVQNCPACSVYAPADSLAGKEAERQNYRWIEWEP